MCFDLSAEWITERLAQMFPSVLTALELFGGWCDFLDGIYQKHLKANVLAVATWGKG